MRHLSEQIDRILDERAGRLIEVIVQMEEPESELGPILRASSEALRGRNLAVSARELIPPTADLVQKRGALSKSERRRLRSSANTMTSQVASAAISSRTLGPLKSAGTDALRPLLQSSLVGEAIKAARNRTKKAYSGSLAPGFNTSWSARSAILRLSENQLRELPSAVSNISSIFPNYKVQLPPIAEVSSARDSGVNNGTSTWGLEKIGALSAWGAYGTRGNPAGTGRPVRVAVLDTGVDPDHPELRGNIKKWAEFDHEGEMVNSSPHDSGEHGTHVCGTISGGRAGAPSRQNPFIGVAPDAEIYAGLVLKGGSGTYFQILAGIDWAIESGAEIINMSLGGVNFQPDVIDAYTRSILNANRLGIPVVVAIGNEGAQTSGAPGNDYFAFAVGATDGQDRAGGFSGGRTQVINESRYIHDDYLPLIYSKPEVSAPGVAVHSCLPNSRYAAWNGTSMAAPHVSGAIALLLAATNIRNVPASRRAYLLQDLITSSVDEFGESGKDHRYGFGRINVLRAIAFAKEQGY